MVTEGTTDLPEQIELKHSGARKVVFRDTNKVLEWTETERAFWKNVFNRLGTEDALGTANPINNFVAYLNDLTTLANNYRNEPQPNRKSQYLNGLLNTFSQLQDERKYIYSKSDRAKKITHALESSGTCAKVLLLRYMAVEIPHTDIRDFNVVFDASLQALQIEHGDTVFTPVSNDMVADAQSEWDSHFEKISAEREEMIVKLNQTIAEGHNRYEVMEARVEQLKDRIVKFLKRVVVKAKETRADINDLHDLYHRKLQLEAPAKYWSDKEQSHKSRARWSAGTFLSALLVLMCLAIAFHSEILSIVPKNSGGELTVGGLLVLTHPAAAIAWGLRIFTRVWAQNTQAASDAAQRATMIKTFLALTKDASSNIRDEERMLILHALFRAAQTGGESDAPPPNLIEVVKGFGVSGRQSPNP